jgi:hypothetical protein
MKAEDLPTGERGEEQARYAEREKSIAGPAEWAAAGKPRPDR